MGTYQERLMQHKRVILILLIGLIAFSIAAAR